MKDSDIRFQDRNMTEKRQGKLKTHLERYYRPCNTVDMAMIKVSLLPKTLREGYNNGFITP
jgi:hypothetical protein